MNTSAPILLNTEYGNPCIRFDKNKFTLRYKGKKGWKFVCSDTNCQSIIITAPINESNQEEDDGAFAILG